MVALRKFRRSNRLMKRSILMMSVFTFSLALLVPYASARATMPEAVSHDSSVRTTMREAVAQDPDPAEAAAYKAWYDANQLKDYAKAMELAKAYLEKFPNGNAKNVEFLKNKWIPG